VLAASNSSIFISRRYANKKPRKQIGNSQVIPCKRDSGGQVHSGALDSVYKFTKIKKGIINNSIAMEIFNLIEKIEIKTFSYVAADDPRQTQNSLEPLAFMRPAGAADRSVCTAEATEECVPCWGVKCSQKDPGIF
jgi:hypothetical protein